MLPFCVLETEEVAVPLRTLFVAATKFVAVAKLAAATKGLARGGLAARAWGQEKY